MRFVNTMHVDSCEVFDFADGYYDGDYDYFHGDCGDEAHLSLSDLYLMNNGC